MAHVGAPFDQPVLRALVRFVAFAGPAVVWLWSCAPEKSDRFALKSNARIGVTVGVIVSIVWALLHCRQQFEIPFSTYTWLNVIALSPFAEELLFRRVVIDHARVKWNAIVAVLIGGVLFSLVHLPWWAMSGEMSNLEIARLLVVMFVYGLVFGTLYTRTKSLWASWIPHVANNFIAQSIVSS